MLKVITVIITIPTMINNSYSKDIIEQKSNKCTCILCGTISRMVKNKTRRETMIQFYKTIAAPTLIYASETCITTKTCKGCCCKDKF